MITLVLPVHRFASVTVTLKFPAVVTLIVCVVAPVDHSNAEKEPAFSVVEMPGQKVKAPVMVGEGGVLIKVVTPDDPEHMLPSITITEYIPGAVTFRESVVAPP